MGLEGALNGVYLLSRKRCLGEARIEGGIKLSQVAYPKKDVWVWPE